MSAVRRTNIISVLSYVAVICCGLALLISWILGNWQNTGKISGALNIIAECLAYFVVACCSFNFARVRGVWWLVSWAVAVVLIVVFKVLGTI